MPENAGMKLSVVVPTYNRKETLRLCLEALGRQNWSGPAFEVLVVDDGSTDGTGEMVEVLARSVPFNLRYFVMGHKGPAAVRNEGIRNAAGEILLFIGDDIIASPRLAEEHVRWHLEHPEKGTAILGYVTWSPELRVTPFMYWLEHGGPCFRYFQFSHGQPVDALWTCNISFKRGYLLNKKGFFDEDFRYAAMEDIELGCRLRGQDFKILYNKNASGFHYHPVNISKHAIRQLRAGSSTKLFWDKHPGERTELPVMPIWKEVFLFFSPLIKLVVRVLDFMGIGLDPRIYDLILYYYFRKGLRGR